MRSFRPKESIDSKNAKNGQVRKLRGEYVVLYVDESRSQAGKRWSRVNQLTGRKSLLSLFVAPRHPGLDCTFERR